VSRHAPQCLPPKDPPRAPRLKSLRYSSSLDIGLSILGCFSSERPVLGIADLSDELGMSRSTTHRYAVTLLELGYLEQDPSRKYRLAPHASDLGMTVLNTIGLRAAARPHLEQLRASTGYTVAVGLLDASEAVYADHLASRRRGQVMTGPTIRAGVRLPAHCTSIGKALLASLPEEQRENILTEGTRRRMTPHTVTEEKRLRTQLEAVSERGFAVSDQELHPGTRSLAVPVHDSSRVVAAVNLSVYQCEVSMSELVKRFYPLVDVTAEKVSRTLEYEPAENGIRADESGTLRDTPEQALHGDDLTHAAR
jgi:IclR family transcriptional regulator, pca regulon regulatory protein